MPSQLPVGHSGLAEVDRFQAILALILVGTAGIASFLILPVASMGLSRDLGFSSAEVGEIATSLLVSQALGSVLGFGLIGRLSWRTTAAIALLGLSIADASSLFARSFVAMLACRSLAGIAGGLAISFAAYALGRTEKPDRNFAWFQCIQVAFSILGLALLPPLMQSFHIEALFLTQLTIDILFLLVLVPRLVTAPALPAALKSVNGPRAWTSCALMLLAIVLFLAATGGFWTYVAPIGVRGGLSEESIGMALSIGLGGGLLGGAIAAGLDVRFGRVIPVTAAVILQCSALSVLLGGFGFTGFAAAATLFTFGWYLFFPYQLGLLAEVDRSGQGLILSNVAVGLGSGLGPLLIAAFIGTDFTAVYGLCFALLALALLVTVGVILATDRSPTTQARP